jgi:SPP1 family predicted phage head-tail adaptor
MNFGKMRDDVILQQPSAPTGAADYDTVETVPAQIEMIGWSGGEALRFGAPTATGYFTITLRYREDIRSDWRIVHTDGRVFQVVSYGDPDGKRQALRVSATTVQ